MILVYLLLQSLFVKLSMLLNIVRLLAYPFLVNFVSMNVQSLLLRNACLYRTLMSYVSVGLVVVLCLEFLLGFCLSTNAVAFPLPFLQVLPLSFFYPCFP